MNHTTNNKEDDAINNFASGGRYRLFECITSLSTSTNWEEAKKEWYLAHIEIASPEEVADNEYQCLCGHKHLKELCYIKNKKNGKEVLVGNCCVKKFLNLESDPIFRAVKKGKVNIATVDYAFKRGIITEWERGFLKSTIRKRKLSFKQSAVLERLHKKIFGEVVSRQ